MSLRLEAADAVDFRVRYRCARLEHYRVLQVLLTVLADERAADQVEVLEVTLLIRENHARILRDFVDARELAFDFLDRNGEHGVHEDLRAEG